MSEYKKALVTLAIGPTFGVMGSYTHPLMKAYAERCNVEFVVISKPKYEKETGLLTYEKFQVAELLNDFDQILFVDTDIVLLPTTPNLFDQVPINVFAAANEEAYSMASTHKTITQEKLGSIDWRNVYFNSGVMIFGKEHSGIFDVKSPIFIKWISDNDNRDHIMSDQPIINYAVNASKTAFIDLGYRFNHTRVRTDSAKRFNSFLIHYAGPSGHRYGDRLTQIKSDCAVARSPFFFALSRKMPMYRWVADRLNLPFLRYISNKMGIGSGQ